MKNFLDVGLFIGRHTMPINEYIFEYHVDFTEENLFLSLEEKAIKFFKEKGVNKDTQLQIYVTGYTPGLIAAINAAKTLECNKIHLLHFNQRSKGFDVQKVK